MNSIDGRFPKFDNSALINGVAYNIPGIFLCSKLIYLFMDMVEGKFGYKLPIKYIYGASPLLRWNGGRLVLNYYDSEFSLKDTEKELLRAVERGITPLLTFSNTHIDNAYDLADEKCNEVLTIINEIEGGVIVTSELLYEYIKEKFPNVKVHASVIKTAYTENRDESYYSLLSDKYDSFVIHPDDNFDINLLKNLPKKNAEIIINERCYYKCEMRKMHYDSISDEQINYSSNSWKNENFLQNCVAIPENKQSFSKKRNISLTTSEVKKLHNLGYNLFKIQGRTDNLNLFFFDLMRYTLESEFVFPNMYAIFSSQIDKFLKGEL